MAEVGIETDFMRGKHDPPTLEKLPDTQKSWVCYFGGPFNGKLGWVILTESLALNHEIHMYIAPDPKNEDAPEEMEGVYILDGYHHEAFHAYPLYRWVDIADYLLDDPYDQEEDEGDLDA